MKKHPASALARITGAWRLPLLSWRSILCLWLPLLALLAAGILATQRLVHPAPTTIRLLGGPEGSMYRRTAEKYKKAIKRFGVKVVVLPSYGSLDNLQKLADPKVKADVGFVQGGLTDGVDISRLVSLGSLFAQPLMVYYRNREPVEFLAQLKGKRLAIGPEGSGARALTLKLLKANGIDGPPTVLLDLGDEAAANDLLAGKIDAAFLMGESATGTIMRKLRTNETVDIASFRQADGYRRKFKFLSKLTLPEGAYDLGLNEPPRTLTLIGPTVELVARNDLHPALSDLLIGAAREIHGGAGLFRNAGEYPAPLARDFPISADAERFYKSGGQFLYKKLPFWLANLIDRLLVIIVPLLVILLPATKIMPALYKWWMRSRIYKWYGALMAIERAMLAQPSAEGRADLIRRIDAIDKAVGTMKTPPSFGDQLFVLRSHVRMVRNQVEPRGQESQAR